MMKCMDYVKKGCDYMKKREFVKAINSCGDGDIIFINAINLSLSAIDQLKHYIKIGMLHPVRKEVEKVIVPLKIEEVMKGEIICPQMTYTVRKGVR